MINGMLFLPAFLALAGKVVEFCSCSSSKAIQNSEHTEA